jgi:hypothetical protein
MIIYNHFMPFICENVRHLNLFSDRLASKFTVITVNTGLVTPVIFRKIRNVVETLKRDVRTN